MSFINTVGELSSVLSSVRQRQSGRHGLRKISPFFQGHKSYMWFGVEWLSARLRGGESGIWGTEATFLYKFSLHSHGFVPI
jgi:hypothetical protein